ncbi:MAG TPA: hypothetical protein VIL63_06395 [Terriglobales bacterium]|jgi:hypothetical protein
MKYLLAISLLFAGTIAREADATCVITVNTRNAIADEIVAQGITLNQAQFRLQQFGRRKLPPGRVLTVISNTAATPINGPFVNLPEGSTVSVGNNIFRLSYNGGDGNDLTLTVLP